MGCGSTKEADKGGADDVNWGNAQKDDDFEKENGRKRVRFDKKSKQATTADPSDKPEFDMFEAEEAGEGEQYMATRPWRGAVVAPSNPPEVNNAAPDVNYELDFVFGYRCEDSRQNLFFNNNNEAVYMTAALGVILNNGSRGQKFFGGGSVENKSKTQSSDTNCHTNDITALSISSDRATAVTGQLGSAPVAFAWDAATGQKKQRFKLTKGARGISAIAISADNKYVAMADLHNDHNIYVYNLSDGQLVWKDKGGVDKIYDMAFNPKDSNEFMSCGVKHIKFWYIGEKDVKKGLFMRKGEPTNFPCCTYSGDGVPYTGGCNGEVYKWEGRCLESTFKCGRGAIHSIRFADSKLLVGGKDGQVYDCTSGKAVAVGKNHGSLIRSIDCKDGNMIVGLRNGDIVDGDGNQWMRSHNEGEVWGLTHIEGTKIATTGDDNQVITWDLSGKVACDSVSITSDNRKAPRGGASSLSDYSDSKCGRSLASNGDSIAIGCNDGSVRFRSMGSLGADIKVAQDSQEWIECMSYSPDGSLLAVGSHDNKIYVYNAGDQSLKYTLTGHNSYITCFDWSCDGKYIRSNCGAYEYLFFDLESGKQDPGGASATNDTEWASQTCHYGWYVDGIFPSGADGTHINGVTTNPAKDLIVCGDDYGLVQIFRSPARVGCHPISLRGHSEHVVRVMFVGDDLVSIGGQDKTVMYWKRK